MKKSFLLYLFLLICQVQAIASAPLEEAVSADRFFEQYSSRFITEGAGLPHSEIIDLLKDSKGFIWVATQRGIARYDGYRFIHFHSRSEGVKLKSDNVRQLAEDAFGRLWVASEGGIDLLSIHDLNLQQISDKEESVMQQLMNESVRALYRDSRNNIWLSTGRELGCIEITKDGIKAYHHLENSGTGHIHAIAEAQGEIWAGIDNLICKIEKGPNHTLTAHPLPQNLLPPFSPDWRILCMQADGDFLWIGTNRGLFRYEPDKQQLKRYRYSTHRPGMLSQAYITDIKLTAEGDLIVATLNGINVYNREKDTFSFIRQNSNRTNINCNAINCLLTENNNIWLGTESGGINLLTKKRLHVEIWQPTANSYPVNTMAEDLQGNLYIARMERGLTVWNRKNNEIRHHLFSPGDMSTISNNTLTGVLIDSDNLLWGYTWGVGFNFLDINIKDNKKFKRYTREEYPAIEGDFTNSACEDRLNRGIWFGTTRGLQFYDKTNKNFQRILIPGENNEFEAIQALCADQKQRLWVGTSRGIYIIDLRSFAQSRTEFHCIKLGHRLGMPHSKEVERINCIFQDNSRNIWLGSNGNGLYLLTSDKDNQFQFRNFTTEDGLASNTINGLANDHIDNLWITTVEGLTMLDTEKMIFSNYTEMDGLPNTHFYINGINYSHRYNQLYLATAKGLAILNVENKSSEETNHQAICTSITAAGVQKAPEKTINLHERDSRLTLTLTTLKYGHSHRIRYAYRLKGHEEWNETEPGDNTLRYNSLPTGDYTLQFKATNELGHWSTETNEIRLSIKPYFYKTIWCYLLLVALIVIGSYLYLQRKTRSYRERQAYLQRKVEQRTSELAERNKQLEEMALHVEQVTEEKITFFTNITHEFRTPATLIHGPITHAIKMTDNAEVLEQLQIAERNSRYLLSLVNEMMDFRKLDAERVVLQPQAEEFALLLDEWLMPFRAFAHERNIGIRTLFRLNVQRPVLDAGYMRKAIVNLVSNAIKFTPDGGKITIYVAQIKRDNGDDYLYINVSDTGYGIVNEDREKIFTRFYQSRQSVTHPVYGQSGTGIGLFLCRRIIELHGGSIIAQNNPGKGSSFRILMPLISEEIKDIINPCEQEHLNLLPQSNEELNKEKGNKQDCILIVEDNKDMRTYIRTILQADYRLFEAGNGEEAIHLVENHSIDLIVSDLMMPVMDGLELSRYIKERLETSHIPFLMLTAIRSEVQEKQSYEIGVDEYLCKPFDEEILRLRIRNILSMRRKYREILANTDDINRLPIREESRDKTFMSNAINLMKENYCDSEYNLERFIRDMGYSKTLVNKKLQELTGQPIGAFMKNYRLNMSLKMLKEAPADINVSEVAYAVGFNDPKYFTKCFKEQFGYLPSSILKQR